jgi:dolichol kinase
LLLRSEEIKRKIIHLSNSVIPLSYYFFVEDRVMMIWILLSITIFFVAVDYFRFRIGWIQKWFRIFFSSMLRKHELEGNLTGATWAFIGATISVFLFEKDIAVLALLFMSVGDTVAALIGQQYGKIKIGKKTIEGFAGGLVSCIFISIFFPSVTWINRIAGSLIASLIELSPIPVDDNLMIPLISGGMMTLFRGIIL